MNSNLSLKKRTLASHPIPITIVSDIDAFNQCLQENTSTQHYNITYLT